MFEQDSFWAYKQLQAYFTRILLHGSAITQRGASGKDRRACVLQWICRDILKKVCREDSAEIVEPTMWSARNNERLSVFFLNIFAFIWMNSDVCFVFQNISSSLLMHCDCIRYVKSIHTYIHDRTTGNHKFLSATQ